MTLEDIARTDVATAAPETTVEELAERMRERNVGSLVVTGDGEPLGMVTDRDVAVRVWEHDDPAAVTAADLMTAEPVTVDVDAGVYEALELAGEANVRRLPVVDGEGLVGIVTLDDVVVLLAGELEGVADVIQAESPPY